MANFLRQLTPVALSPAWDLVCDQEPGPRADPKDLWRTAREQAHYSGADRPDFAKTQRVQADQYLRFAYKSMNYRVYVREGRVKVEPDPIYRPVDAVASANFFEHSDAQTFTFFCGLVRRRLSEPKVVKRIEVFASCLSSLLIFGSARLQLRDKANRETTVRTLAAPVSKGKVEDVHPSPSSLLQEALALIESNQTTRGLDLLYKTVDDVLYSGSYSILGKVFGEVDVSTAPISFLLGLLTATLPVKTRLSERRNFFDAVKDAITARGENTESLLAGLE
jgi:hypothetical protein